MSMVVSDESLRPYLQQVDEIEAASKRLECVVDTLEGYVTSLGIYFNENLK